MTPGRKRVLWTAVLVATAGLAVILTPDLRERPSPWDPRREPPEGWNLLLVSLDTTRPDYLKTHGGAQVPTPALDRLAGEGFLFQEMIAPAPITLPSHASLFTGLDPHRHGVRENTEYALPEGSRTLARALSAAGYRTAAFCASFVLDARFGLAQGFQEYQDRLDGPEPGLGPRSVEIPASIMAARAGRWITDYAAARRGGREENPFFLFLHFYDAHAPYRPPPPYDREYAGSPYAGELAFQDLCLGSVLDVLESTAEASRTLVWVVSDHGESLGEHGESAHSLFIYDATQRAVSVLALPPEDGRYDSGKPRLRIPVQTGLIDVPSTLCDLAGVTDALGPVDGISLLPLIRGEPWPERPLYQETLSPWVSYHWSPLYGVRTREWKYIRAPIPELYDLAADPAEMNNLAGARPNVVREMEQILDQMMSRGGPGGKPGLDADSGADGPAASNGRVAPGPSARREPTAEEMERLRSLGYLAGTEDAASRTQGGPGAPPIHGADGRTLPDPKRMVRFFHQQYQAAKNLLYSGRYGEAAEAFRQALQVDPLNNSLYLYLAGALRQSGDLEGAAQAYREALRIAPRSPRAEFGLGEAYLAAGRADSAAAAFRRAADLLPGSPDSWRRLATALWILQDLDSAAAAFETALGLGSDPVRIHGYLARLYGTIPGSAERANRHLESYARLRGLPVEEARTQLPPAPTGVEPPEADQPAD